MSSAIWRRRRSRDLSLRAEQHLAVGDAADGRDEVVAAHVLQDVAPRAGEHRGVDGFVVGERRQHEAPQVGSAFVQGAAQVDAAAVGEAHVEHRDVQLLEVDVECLGERAGLGHDLEVALGLEQFAQSPAHDLVVVDE